MVVRTTSAAKRTACEAQAMWMVVGATLGSAFRCVQQCLCPPAHGGARQRNSKDSEDEGQEKGSDPTAERREHGCRQTGEEGGGMREEEMRGFHAQGGEGENWAAG